MNVADFDFELPQASIAQRPASERDHSRLLVLDRGAGMVGHRQFDELPELLRGGDLLVLNDTRVLPARLVGHKRSGGRVELLLVERVERSEDHELWRCLLHSSRKPRRSSTIALDQGLVATVLDREAEEWTIRLECASGPLAERLERAGQAPLPPYIRRGPEGPDADDRERYQTIFAGKPGAIAAPTAGLHFTDGLFDRLRRNGVEVTTITLHVGPGTFWPVRTERIEDHRMHEERFDLPETAARAVADARRRGGRVIAVGTTVVRTLESRSKDDGTVVPGSGRAGLFIYPGFRFRVVDAMITNFHLPRSTLLMLVSAFAGRDRVLESYRQAVAAGYRFYSYGDAMLIEGAA